MPTSRIRRRCCGEGDGARQTEAGHPRPAGGGGAGIAAQAGFAVGGARVGRLVDLEVDAASSQEAKAQVERMCQELLANPLIESFEIEVDGA